MTLALELYAAFSAGWMVCNARRSFVRQRRAGRTIKDIVTKPVTGGQPDVPRVTEVS